MLEDFFRIKGQDKFAQRENQDWCLQWEGRKVSCFTSVKELIGWTIVIDPKECIDCLYCILSTPKDFSQSLSSVKESHISAVANTFC